MVWKMQNHVTNNPCVADNRLSNGPIGWLELLHKPVHYTETGYKLNRQTQDIRENIDMAIEEYHDKSLVQVVHRIIVWRKRDLKCIIKSAVISCAKWKGNDTFLINSNIYPNMYNLQMHIYFIESQFICCIWYFTHYSTVGIGAQMACINEKPFCRRHGRLLWIYCIMSSSHGCTITTYKKK